MGLFERVAALKQTIDRIQEHDLDSDSLKSFVNTINAKAGIILQQRALEEASKLAVVPRGDIDVNDRGVYETVAGVLLRTKNEPDVEDELNKAQKRKENKEDILLCFEKEVKKYNFQYRPSKEKAEMTIEQKEKLKMNLVKMGFMK
eukprot:GHVP01068449.1.p1 GENE.GHVP01068449.1~~GHVP01068449.1.p1  ORF type:complete len:146 (+),score=39.04 GHVP01068449.1:647-1084(+)